MHDFNHEAMRVMVNHSNKRTTLSPSKKQMHIEAYLSSGLTMTAYCKQGGFAISTFSNWVAKYYEVLNVNYLCRSATIKIAGLT